MDRAELLRRKAKIEMLLPMVRQEHTTRLFRLLERISLALGAPSPQHLPFPRDPQTSSAGTNGVGALQFQAKAPPGPGRLIKLPFYLTSAPDGRTITDGGVGQPALVNPVVTVISDWNAGQTYRTTGLTFQTRIVSFADLRIVGFQVAAKFRLQYGYTIPPFDIALNPFFQREAPVPSVLVKGLTVGGGVNLFPQDEYVDATVYSSSVPEFAGLRDYPILRNPNVVSVTMATLALSYGTQEAVPIPILPAPFGAPAAGRPYVYIGIVPAVGVVRPVVSVSCNLVAEILDDEIFGRGIPGPYARRDALVRTPNELSLGSFSP